MKLVEFITTELNILPEHLLLLRHSTENVAMLLSCGATIDEYTAIQPTGSKYDYRLPSKPHTEVVVVIADDRVYGVFRVAGIEAEGTTYSLATPAYRHFDETRKRRERPARRYRLQRISSAADGLAISGWERRQRTPVQRSDGLFFYEIEVAVSVAPPLADDFQRQFDQRVERSRADGAAARGKRLLSAPKLPTRVEVRAFVFYRNADVVAEVLARAHGICELCQQPAPFVRRADATPYLEIHHRLPLAAGGEDTVDNAIAVCPNCHRHRHFGLCPC